MLAIFVQDQRSKTNLFLHTKSELSQQQALLLSIQFGKQISATTEIKGQIILFDTYRAIFSLLNEVYVVTIGYLSEFPFDVVEACENVKNTLVVQLKGFDITTLNLLKKYGQIYTIFEELLFTEPKKEKEDLFLEKDNKMSLSNICFDNDLEVSFEPELLEFGYETFTAPLENSKVKSAYFEEESRFKELKDMDEISKENLESMISLNNTLITQRHFEPKLRKNEAKLDSFQPLVLEKPVEVPPKPVDPPKPEVKLPPIPKVEKKPEPIKEVVQPEPPKPLVVVSTPIQPIVLETTTAIEFLPLTITISETVHVQWKNQEMGQYKVIGKIGVKRFSNDHLTQKLLKFQIKIRNTKVIHQCVSNKSLCTDLEDFTYDCIVPIEEFGPKQDLEVALLKYSLSPEFKPIPLQVIPKRIIKEDGINFMIKYKMNPNTPLDKLSFLVQPVDGVESGVKIVKTEFKPDAKWNGEKLLWRFISPEKENKLMVIFKTEGNPSETKMGPLLLQFNCVGSLFSRIIVDGCDGKKNGASQVFVGGCQMVITAGKYEIEITD